MLGIKPDLKLTADPSSTDIPLFFHSSSQAVYIKIKQWIERFPNTVDDSFYSDFLLFYLLATKKFLDHRVPSHLFRMILSIHLMQKKLLHYTTCFPHHRHSLVRGLTASLFYPFSSKQVLGCLIGFNVMDRYEIYDEENILLSLQKYLPNLRLVKESSYNHVSSHKNLKIFYFEVEKRDGTLFTVFERLLLKSHLESRIKSSIQLLSPTIFMGMNEEETYKHIITLSQEIDSLSDLPQVYISLLQQTGKEIIFQVILVYIASSKKFSLEESFADYTFTSKSKLTVRNLEGHPIEAHVFCLHLKRSSSLLRSDGSLDFHSARQQVAGLLRESLGDIRDYNGGIIVMRHELLRGFKEQFPEYEAQDPELMESFFYSLTPLEKQVLIKHETLCSLFSYFKESSRQKLNEGQVYSLNTHVKDDQLFVIIQGETSSLTEVLSEFLQEQILKARNFFYNIVHVAEGSFINCVFTINEHNEDCLKTLEFLLNEWRLKVQNIQTLKIGLENTALSLDPRIGGDNYSRLILKLLFEGLTRFGENGKIENALAESIQVTSDAKCYTFKLKSSCWNDGSKVTAHDFEYAWKKILSPNFKTAFAYHFYPIKNAKEAKEGKVSANEIGIQTIDEHTLQVLLDYPAPYFLQLTADPLYSPVNRLIDQEHPEWPYQSEKNYPCNGPFELKVNQPLQGYQFIKNPHYWNSPETSLNQINMIKMASPQAIQAFQKKEIDWIGNPFGVWDPIYNNQKEGKVISFENLFVTWCVFNTASSPFQHPKLRQAFAYALRRDQIIEGAPLPLKPAYSPLIPLQSHKSTSQFPKYNGEEAKKLLDEALKDLGLDKETFTFNFLSLDKGIAKYIALSLQAQLKECLGIHCNLELLPWNKVFQQMTQSKFQVGLMHWTTWLDDPSYTLNTFRSTHQEVNFSKWENMDYQLLMDLSDQELNPLIRSVHLQKAEEILNREMPVIPLVYQPSQSLVRKDLQVIWGPPCVPFNLAKTYFKKEI